MVNPQKEEGYTPIANELFEAFYRCKMVEYERVVIMCIWRKTYGWNKREDWVSNSQIHKETGIALPNITRTLKSLLSKGLVCKKGRLVCVNKLYNEWKVDWRIKPEKLSHQITKVISPDNKKLSHQIPTKAKSNITKESTKNMKKETYIDYESGEEVEVTKPKKTSNKEIISLVHLFEKRGEEVTGVKPDLTKAYFKLQQAMKNHSLSPDDVKSLFTHFFNNRKLTNEQKISLGLCISGSYITQWKVSEKNRPVSQVAAASEIIL